LTQVSDNDD